MRLHVSLDTTFWQFAATDNAVLRVVTAPSAQPAPSCIPGGGCGTVSAVYLAVRPGTTDITATRSSCGEAMGCSAQAGRFVVHVVVS